eukprot:gb/GFBE01008678.1/.p1 GENE.gb/GFBE01008678.1/~~gb/GFBE01008678.1/.p1  ORF type:complete len:1041 (+),score=255.90 gb/GFBE01008678.1/:1-3123(+)
MAGGRCFALGPGLWQLQAAVAPGQGTDDTLTARCAFHFCLDNSGSMGRNTKEAQDCFAQLVEHATAPCSMTVFASNAVTLSSSLTTPAEVRNLMLPRQGQTDISSGVARCLELIMEQEAGSAVATGSAGAVHHVLFLLSDGAHNVGPGPAQVFPRLAREIRSKAPQLRLSVVVVGISSSSSTCHGMLGRAELETVPLTRLEPIYYANSAAEMSTVLGELEVGILGLVGGRVARVELPPGTEGGFVRVPGEAAVGSMEVFVGPGGGQLELTLQAATAPSQLVVDGVKLTLTEDAFDEHVATEAVKRLIASLRERRVGSRTFDGSAAVAFLEPCIRAIANHQDAIFAASAEATKKDKRLTPAARVRQHKALAGAQHGARQLRNQLTEAVTFHSNDSAEQARFLTGASSKYGAKALRRAAGHGVSHFEAYVQSVAATAQELRLALRQDLLGHLARLQPEQRAVVARAMGSMPHASEDCLQRLIRDAQMLTPESCDVETATLLDSGCLVEALRKALGDCAASVSFVSLLSQWEQLAEWVQHASDREQIRAAGVGSEYELLMYVGMLGFPIKVGRSAATQMDPFQLKISFVHASPADSASICCAMQSEQTVSAPEGDEVKDLLLLVDPDCPNASGLALKCKLFDVYTSVVLCRDLHMYTGTPMRIALHAHALMSVVGSAGAATESQLEIALRICYSARKHFESEPWQKKEYERLLTQMQDWDELTTKEGVMDPSQLFLALTVFCDSERFADAVAPPAVLMALNETLARKARHRFKSQAGAEAHKAKILAAECVRGFLGITEDSAPQAAATDEPEPARADVEAGCQRDVNLDTAHFDFENFTLESLVPTLSAFSFAIALHAAMEQRGGGWSNLESDMERGRPAYKDVLAVLQSERPAMELHGACDFDKAHQQRILATMTAQAMLCSDSSERRELPDVREADTLSQIAVRLRMDTYSGRVAMKLQDWRAVAVDVTAARARAADIGQFEGMIGCHAHGLCKGSFWGLWDAARHDGYGGEKVRAFLSKANQDFANKYGSKDCASASKKR